MKKYIVNETRLQQLLKNEEKLELLENAGVDNWEWYEEAFEDYDSDDEYDLSTIFKEYKEEKEEKEREIIKKKLERYAEEHNEEKIDWNDHYSKKYFLMFYPIENEIDIATTNTSKFMGGIYFTDHKIAEEAIKEIGEDKIKKLFEE